MVPVHPYKTRTFCGCKDIHCFAISILFVEKVNGILCIFIHDKKIRQKNLQNIAEILSEIGRNSVRIYHADDNFQRKYVCKYICQCHFCIFGLRRDLSFRQIQYGKLKFWNKGV